ncbi:MAG: HU family DNA-binding protein [Ignavibacteria bacterium]|nr:HU family DNA-binding protein [Ignavibacteria bacterium]
MNSIDLISRISNTHNLSVGRTEMIFSIIVEKIIDRLKKDGKLIINNFGEFRVEKSEGVNRIKFYPSQNFLDRINSV